MQKSEQKIHSIISNSYDENKHELNLCTLSLNKMVKQRVGLIYFWPEIGPC